MKIAFTHCWIMNGGALNVFKNLIKEETFKQAKVFTLLSETKNLNLGESNLEIKTALPWWINQIFLFFRNKNIPILSSIFDYRNLIIFSPFLMKILSKKIKKYNPDKIVISSFAVAKNIDQCLNDETKTKLYLHSPMQYIRDSYEEYTEKIKGLKLRFFKLIVPYLRKRDQKFTKFDEVFFNSKYTQKLAKKIYGLKGSVKYPQIEEIFWNTQIEKNPLDYFVYVGRIVKFSKECEKIIDLFNEIDEPLLMIGDGPDEKYLKRKSKGNIIFLGRIKSNKERAEIMRKAKGLINITKESFGIVTAESLILGVPIFGYNQGASKELVDEKSGLLIEKKDLKNLKKSFHEFKNTKFDRDYITKRIREKLI